MHLASFIISDNITQFCLWYFVLWFSSCWSGVELRVMCAVCRMLQQTNLM